MAGLACLVLCRGLAHADEPLRLTIVGGLAGVPQYTELEQPFWLSELTARSGGRITATIRPYDTSGLRGQEMLQMMRLGVVPFGTAALGLAATEDPELNAVDLPTLNPDMPTLRRTVALYRDHIGDILRDRHNITLLAIYAYPAQVLFCTKPFAGLADMAGRRVRTSSVAQSEMMSALGAVPVIVPFAEIVTAMRDGVADCAITGTSSGHAIGLPAVTTHVHALAINWGLTFFGANAAAWAALPDSAHRTIREGVADLETRIWARSDEDTRLGLACNTGTAACPAPQRRSMVLVPGSAADEGRRRDLLTEHVIPRWVGRCGAACATAWNAALGPALDIRAAAP